MVRAVDRCGTVLIWDVASTFDRMVIRGAARELLILRTERRLVGRQGHTTCEVDVSTS